MKYLLKRSQSSKLLYLKAMNLHFSYDYDNTQYTCKYKSQIINPNMRNIIPLCLSPPVTVNLAAISPKPR